MSEEFVRSVDEVDEHFWSNVRISETVGLKRIEKRSQEFRKLGSEVYAKE
jgi:hypothetical protein